MSRRISLFDSIGVDPFKDKESERSWQKQAVKILKTIVSDKLTWRQKEIIMLYYYKGLSQRDIAKRLGISESAVSHTKSAALKRLKYYLEILRR